MQTEGASPNERLLAAARADNESMFQEVVGSKDDFDINCEDGAGDTPLHLAVKNVSIMVLELILTQEDCDVDPQNRLTKETPLHYAIKLEDPEDRVSMVGSLLEAGADTTIKDKNGDTVLDLLSQDDTETRNLILGARAQNAFDDEDIASDDDDDGESGTDSGSE